ncbi:hypothetical protein [Pseudohoeflea coraliihabitans]|uniref:Uncharacterized protein n=1 Tax=Pseudohoeflea coraliihabitans TaxID=2860393 RepID=A0ABS6WQ22_9HYPH|nr:hypothetical protein [Pseudohoeflea sp. DP4N28-3]MBW3097482.1 hypothetical protein [Pseudohoeflea sp. DP4N28-3]
MRLTALAVTSVMSMLVSVPHSSADGTPGVVLAGERIGDIIERWHMFSELCQGGSGDDPATLKACEGRSMISQQLEGMGYCLGKEHQSRSQHRWHRCGAGSIRSM